VAIPLTTAFAGPETRKNVIRAGNVQDRDGLFTIR
jgi:hypothetical protein